MILFHPHAWIFLVLLHHIVVRISILDWFSWFPSDGGAFRSDEWCSPFAFDDPAVVCRQISTVCVDISEVPEWFEEKSQLSDLMDIGFREMEADDSAPLHIDSCMQFHVLFGAECSFYFLPGLVELSDGKSSCIDGNVLSFFLNLMASLSLR